MGASSRSRCVDCTAHSSTHPEGWREWPYETPATGLTKDTVPIPSGSNDKPGRCGTAVSNLQPHKTRRRFFHMPPESLRCKECKADYPLDARYVCERCFGPLEVAYGDRSTLDPAEV